MDSTIFVTSAPNDRDLAQGLGNMALVCPLPHGDACFFGYPDPDQDGYPIRVCIERKKLQDMVGCILSGRYLHQVQCAHEAGFKYLCLILEVKDIRPGEVTGLVETLSYKAFPGRPFRPMRGISLRPPKAPKRSWTTTTPEIPYSRFDQFFTEIQRDMGVIYKRSHSIEETVSIVKATWLNFQKPPDEHHSLEQIYTQPHRVELLNKPGLVRRAAKEIDGIGWERSLEVSKRFHTVSSMCAASVRDWESIPGIGKKIARSAVSQLTGRKVE